LRGVERFFEIGGFLAAANVEARDLLAVGADDARFEGFAARRRKGRQDRPVLLRNEGFDFALAIADETERH
jgi:hypothetical protein